MLKTPLHLSPVGLQIVVIKVGADVHAAPSQGKQPGIGIDEIRVVLINQVARPIVIILHIGDCQAARYRGVLGHTAVVDPDLPTIGLCRRPTSNRHHRKCRPLGRLYRLRATFGTTTNYAAGEWRRRNEILVFERQPPKFLRHRGADPR